MRTDIAIEKLCSVVPFIADIAEDLKNNQEMKDFVLQYNADKKNKVFMIRVLPLLLKHYSKEVYEVLAILGDKTADEIKEQPFGTTFNQLKGLVEDEDFRSFFSSFFESKKKEQAE